MTRECYNLSYGALIKRKREERGVSQRELAKWLEMNHHKLMRFEHDKQLPNIEEAQLIASILDFPIIEFENVYWERQWFESYTEADREVENDN